MDVLELELASRRLSAANARLSTSNERLAHFAGQVSHDLKNPLTSISLSLETLELDIDGARPARHLARARRGVDRMTDMINNLLDSPRRARPPATTSSTSPPRCGAALDDLTGRIAREQVGRRRARRSCAATPPSCARC